MNFRKFTLLAGFAALTLGFNACSEKEALSPENDAPVVRAPKKTGDRIPGQYIVVFKKDARKSVNIDDLGYEAAVKLSRGLANEVLADNKIALKEDDMLQVYGSAVQGFAARLSDEAVLRLKNDSRIDYIEEDKIITLNEVANESGAPKAQNTPWGITRVRGGVSGVGKTVWVLDTGIDLDHADLTVNTSLSRSFITGESADDGQGHGTHCAGTIAARNNTIGVIGVAAGATVVAVKVLSNSGSGSNSAVIAGVDYVRANGVAGQVANMSLGGGASTTIDNAVLNAASRGIKFAVAAGNESQNANNVSPARVNGTNIFTVSAHDSSDRFASFSNFANPPIDICAPGVSVYSTYKNGGYATLSGTSMATPHVAGILALGTLYSRGTVIGDRDTTPDKLATR